MCSVVKCVTKDIFQNASYHFLSYRKLVARTLVGVSGKKQRWAAEVENLNMLCQYAIDPAICVRDTLIHQSRLLNLRLGDALSLRPFTLASDDGAFGVRLYYQGFSH